MLEMHIREPGFRCSACRPFTNIIDIIQKFNETGVSHLFKASFQHDMAFRNLKIKREEQLLIKYCIIEY